MFDPSGDSGVVKEAFAAGEADDFRESLQIQLEHAAAKRRHPIVPATLVVVFRAPAMRRVFDESGGEHALDRAVERPWSRTDFAAGRFLDLLGNGVPMPLAVSEREEDVEDDRRERELSARVGRSHAPLYP